MENRYLQKVGQSFNFGMTAVGVRMKILRSIETTDKPIKSIVSNCSIGKLCKTLHFGRSRQR